MVAVPFRTCDASSRRASAGRAGQGRDDRRSEAVARALQRLCGARQVPVQAPRREGSPAEKAGGGMWPGGACMPEKVCRGGLFRQAPHAPKQSGWGIGAAAGDGQDSPAEAGVATGGMAGDDSAEGCWEDAGHKGRGVRRAWLGGFARCRPQGQRVQPRMPELGIPEASGSGQEPHVCPLHLPGMARESAPASARRGPAWRPSCISGRHGLGARAERCSES